MWRLLLGLPIVVVIVLIGLVVTPALASCGEHDDLVKQAVQGCPRARELLGDDAHPARLGCACGTTEMEGNYGRASWSVPYTGSRARGTVEYDASEQAGTWRLDRATLEVDNEAINLVACARPASTKQANAVLAQTNADEFTANLVDGKVIRSTHATIKVGAACRGKLDRTRGSPTAHMSVSCDGAPADPFYDGRGTFTLDVRDSTRRDDDRTEYDDTTRTDTGTSGCRFSSSGNIGTITLWSSAYEIVVEL